MKLAVASANSTKHLQQFPCKLEGKVFVRKHIFQQMTTATTKMLRKVPVVYSKSLTDENIRELSVIPLPFIVEEHLSEMEEGFVVEVFLRLREIHGKDDNILFQKALKSMGVTMSLSSACTLANKIRCHTIPDWKKSKQKLAVYFDDRKIYFDQNGNHIRQAKFRPGVYANKQADRMIEMVKERMDPHVFLKRWMDRDEETLLNCIVQLPEIVEKMEVQFDYTIDANMQANWRDDIGLSYHMLRLMRKDLGTFMAPERAVIEEVASRNEAALPVETIFQEVENNTIEYSMCNFREKLEICSRKLISMGLVKPKDGIIKIKISGDGYLRTHRLGHVLFTFTFLDTDLAHQSYATWDMCIMAGSEEMATVSVVMHSISEQLMATQNLSINEVPYKVEYFFTSDQKFLSLVLGIAGPNTKYFCPWCECPKNERGAITKDFPLRHMDQLIENAVNVPSKKTTATSWRTGEGKGAIMLPSLNQMDFDHIIPDVMHLGLRIVEKLLVALYRRYVLDPVCKEKYLEEVRKILANKNWEFKTKKTGEYCKPRLDGATMKYVVMNVATLIFRRRMESNEIWGQIQQLGLLLKKILSTLWRENDFNLEEKEQLKKDIDTFATLWTQSVFTLHSWNNSCHVLHKHVPKYLDLYGNLGKYSQEHVESEIGRMKNFLRQTSNKSKTNTKELLQYDNRKLDRLEEILERKKKPACNACNGSDHSRRSSKKCPYHSR